MLFLLFVVALVLTVAFLFLFVLLLLLLLLLLFIAVNVVVVISRCNYFFVDNTCVGFVVNIAISAVISMSYIECCSHVRLLQV